MVLGGPAAFTPSDVISLREPWLVELSITHEHSYYLPFAAECKHMQECMIYSTCTK